MAVTMEQPQVLVPIVAAVPVGVVNLHQICLPKPLSTVSCGLAGLRCVVLLNRCAFEGGKR